MKFTFTERIKKNFRRERHEVLDIFKGLYDYQLEAVRSTDKDDRYNLYANWNR